MFLRQSIKQWILHFHASGTTRTICGHDIRSMNFGVPLIGMSHGIIPCRSHLSTQLQTTSGTTHSLQSEDTGKHVPSLYYDASRAITIS